MRITAGFGVIEMHVLEVMRRMPASVVEDMARAPYARDVAAVKEDVRQAVGQEVSAALRAYRDGDAVVIPKGQKTYPFPAKESVINAIPKRS